MLEIAGVLRFFAAAELSGREAASAASRKGRFRGRGRQALTAALVSDWIPFTSFAGDHVHEEFERLRALGVGFTREPAEMGP